MRVIDGQLFRFPIEAQQGQKLRRTLANLIASETMNATYEGQIIGGRQIIEESQVFRDHADLAFSL